MKLIYLIINLLSTTSYVIPKLPYISNPFPRKTKTYIHIEKFNEKYNLLHIGVSFIQGNKCARFDFRQAEDQISFMTYSNNPLNIFYIQIFNRQIPFLRNEIDIYPFRLVDYQRSDEYFETIDIYWGISNKSLDEIIEYEKTLNKKYILGFNDCRHYSRKLTNWALDKPTPIWKLHKLFYKYKKNYKVTRDAINKL
jgi:hypothetical protein